MNLIKKVQHDFGVIYNVAHDGFLMKAFAHRYQNHPKKRSIFLINKSFEGVTDSKAFDKTRFVYMDMHEFSKDEEGFLEDRIVRRMESLFRVNEVSIEKYKAVYSFVDEVDLVGVYCENKGIEYHSIEVVPNLFHRQSKFRSFDLESITKNKAITRSPGYDNIIIKHGLRYGGGKMCKQQIFMSNTHKFPDYVTNITTVSYWDYKGILSVIPQHYMNRVMAFYKLLDGSFDKKQEASLVVLSSKNMFSHHKRTEGHSNKRSFDREFMLAYLLIADFFSQYQDNVYFKPHPRESKFNFSSYINEKSLIPPLFPTELIQYIDGFEIKELLSTTSSAGDYFTDDKRPNSVTLGTAYYAIYPSLVKLFVVMELCHYCSVDIQNLYTSDLPQSMIDVFLKKNINYTNVNLLRLFKDIEANDNVFIIANSMIDRDKRNLERLIKESNKRLTVIFFKPSEFRKMFEVPEFLENIKEIIIKKKPLLDASTPMALDDEVIYIYESSTSNFEGIEEFSLKKELIYSGVDIHASCQEKISVEDIRFRVNAELKASVTSRSRAKKGEAKSSKFREIGNPLKRTVDYDTKIENGFLHIELSGLPQNICVGYELLLNMSLVDTLSPSFVARATFELRNFGNYSVRLRFYKSDNLNHTIYRYDTKLFDYTLSSAARALNPEEHDCKNAIDRFERLLFEESHHKEQRAKLLLEIVQQMSLGYSFIDQLLSRGVTSLYFYCEERDWEFGHALFSMLYNNGMIEIKNCISDRPFIGDSIGGIHRKVKFVSRESCHYEVGENVFIVTVLPQSDLENEFIKSGLNIHTMEDVQAILQKGLFVNPYIDFKERKEKVDIIFIRRPLHISKIDFDSRSENENDIVSAKMTMHGLQNQLRRYPPVIPLALEEHHATLDDMMEFAAYSQQMSSDFGSHGRPVDRKGDLVNVTDGYRVTTDQPDQFDNTIYFYGGSMIYSPFTSDDKTSSSFLQRMLNDHFGKSYRVVNCGGWTSLTQANIIRNTVDREYRDGDKIIVMPERHFPKREELEFTLIDLENIYIRPHENGEIWVGVQSNVNEVGQKLIAEGVFDALKKNRLI